jgi:hypothetical protein
MARDKRNDSANGGGLKFSGPIAAPPEVKKNNALVDAFGKITHTANGLVKPIEHAVFNPALPFQALDNLISKIPVVGPVITNGVPGPEQALEGGFTLASQAAEKLFNKAADYVGKHGKKDPNQTQVAAKPADGHGLSASVKSKSKNPHI